MDWFKIDWSYWDKGTGCIGTEGLVLLGQVESQVSCWRGTELRTRLMAPLVQDADLSHSCGLVPGPRGHGGSGSWTWTCLLGLLDSSISSYSCPTCSSWKCCSFSSVRAAPKLGGPDLWAASRTWVWRVSL